MAGPTRFELAIRREVPTDGLIACDTHVHTFTHSGHGDAKVEERAITLAGEGIELPIATDHDHLTDDLAAAAERMGVRAYFTPVVGDEVTTRVGHFNAFPLPTDRPVPSNRVTNWAEILRGIRTAPANGSSCSTTRGTSTATSARSTQRTSTRSRASTSVV